MKPPRAYLMLEVGVCGALAATVLLGLVVQMSSARVDTVIEARKLVAHQIAVETLERVRNASFGAVAAPPPQVRVVNGAHYNIDVGVFPGNQSVHIPALDAAPPGSVTTNTLALPFKTIQVVVRFDTHRGPKVIAVSSRAYSE